MRWVACFLVVVALPACSPEIRDDWFLCDPSLDGMEVCPDGFHCAGGICQRGGTGGMDAGRPDGGAETDAGWLDGSFTDDGHVTDADPGVDGGPVICSGETTDCSGTCVDLQSDDDHCGMCGRQCDECAPCMDGSCVPLSTGARCVRRTVPCAMATCEGTTTLACVPTPECSDGRGGGLVTDPGAVGASTCDGESCVACGGSGQPCCADYGDAFGGGPTDRPMACESMATCPVGGTC